MNALEEVARGLLAPLLQLERPSPTGWRLVGWDAEHGVSLTLGRGDVLILVELEARDDTRPCAVRTGRFNISARHSFAATSPLSAESRAVVDQVARIVREREDALPWGDRQLPTRRAECREVDVGRVLVAEGAGHYYVNPYVGCMIGCEFCFVAERADLSRELEGLPRLDWGRYVTVKVNAAEVLREEVRRHPPGIVRLSPIVTDPYQPLERKFRITRQCLEVLREASFTPVILTRSALVLEDLDLLRSFDVAAVGLSIPTDDDRVRQRFEPGGDPIEERLDALVRLHEAGIRTFAAIQPVLPMNPDRLVEKMAPYICAVRIDRMHRMDRALALYEAAGHPEAATDEWFNQMMTTLRQGFSERGVSIDDLDDLGHSLGLVGK
jgi:DNA repair photolyase